MSRQKKKVIVLSDNDLLYRAIEVNLRCCLEVEVSSRPEQAMDSAGGQAQTANVDLIVVAMSLPSGEPLVSLVRASLVGLIGQIPILIISERPFYSDLEERIVHLDFPFQPEELSHKARVLLDGNGSSPEGQRGEKIWLQTSAQPPRYGDSHSGCRSAAGG